MAEPTDATVAKPKPARVASLDQFRGYTVAGMLLVNFVSGYAAIPAILKHHNTYCSYADTIMPQFFFAVGYAFRLSYLKRVEREGVRAAVRHAIGRNLGLLLLGVVFYHLDGSVKTWADLEALGFWGVLKQAFRREPFQTLTHIALASLWCLPVIGRSASVRWVFAIATAVLHIALSWSFYFELAVGRPVIDGGPLGFLTWSIPVIVGSFAYDWTIRKDARGVVSMILCALATMAGGYALSNLGGSTPPPFVAPSRPIDMWMMSQRTGSVSYQVFASGFSLAVYLFFLLVADRFQWTLGVFRQLGRNALAAYLVHGMVFSCIKPYTPKDAPPAYVLGAFALAFAVVALFMRHLEREEIFLKL